MTTMTTEQGVFEEGFAVKPFFDLFTVVIIGPVSDHWLCLSLTDWLTDWLTNCRLVNLIDVSLACEDGNSKLIEVVDDEKQFTP